MVFWLLGITFAIVAVVVAVTQYGSRKSFLFLVGVTAGLEHAQVHKIHLFVFAVFLLILSGRRKGSHGLTRSAVIIPVATAILCVSVPIGTLVNSRVFALQLLLLSLTAAALVVTLTRHEAKTVLSGLLSIVSFASAVAVLQYAHVLPLVLFGGEARPAGIYSEPDWLGLFAALGIVLAARVPLRSRVRFCLMSLNGVACAVAAARGAWFALVIVVALGTTASIIVRNNPDKRPGTVRLIGVFAIAAVLAISFDGSLRQIVVTRVQEIIQIGGPDISVQARLNQTRALLDLAHQEPWHGFGLSAEGRVQAFGQIQYEGTSTNNVTSDWVLGWWVDGGYLALPLIALFFYAAFRRLPQTAGLLLLLVLVNGFFSNATALPITWLLLALVMNRSQAALYQEEPTVLSMQRSGYMTVNGAV